MHVVRSPLAHATITGIDTDAAAAGARRRRRLHRGRPGRRGGRPALRLADHAGHEGPAAPAAGHQHRALRRRGRRRRGRPQRRPRPGTPPTWSRSTTTRSSRCSTWRPRWPMAPRWCTRTWAPTRTRPGCSTPAQAGTGGSVDEAIAAAEADPDSDRGQAPVPPAAADPGVHGAALVRGRPDRRADDHLVGHPGAAHPAHHDRGDPRRAREQAAGDRPRRRRRLRRQDRRAARGDALRRCSRRSCGKPVKWTETRSESLLAAHHGRDQIQDITITAKRDGTVTGLDVTCSPTWAPTSAWSARACRSSARSCSTRSTRSRRYQFTCTNVFTNKTLTDAYRGAGRPEATFAIERIMDELAVELGRDPMELREQELDHPRGVPVHHGRRADLRLGQLRAGHRPGDGAVRLRRACAASSEERRAIRRPGAARHRHLDVHRDVRARPVAGARLAVLRRRRLGGRQHPDAGHRQGRGDHRHLGARPGPRDGVQPDRRRPARACRSRTSRSCTATPRSRRRAWTPTARGRWSSAASRSSRPREKVIAKANKHRGAPARGVRGRHRVRRRASSPSGAPTRASPSRSWRSPRSWRTTTRRTWSPSLDSDAVFDPENFSFPHGTHLAAVEIDTETGHVDLRKYVCVDDVGIVVNPLIVEGQVHGGLAQGIAQALFEEANYDEQGTLVNGTFVDYTLPSAADLPSFDTGHGEHAGDVEPAGRQGRRRGRHHRLHAGHRQRGDRRAAPPRRDRRRDALHVAAGVAGHPGGQGAVPPSRPRSTPTRRAPGWARSTRTTRSRRRSSDPGQVRLRQAGVGRRGGAGAGRRRGGRQDPGRRPEPDPGAAAAAGRAVGAHRPRRHRRAAAASARTATGSRSAR